MTAPFARHGAPSSVWTTLAASITSRPTPARSRRPFTSFDARIHTVVARRAALAFATQPQPEWDHAVHKTMRTTGLTRAEDEDEPLSPDARRDIERALHPSWDELQANPLPEDDEAVLDHREHLYHDAEEAEHPSDPTEWIAELQRRSPVAKEQAATNAQTKKARAGVGATQNPISNSAVERKTVQTRKGTAPKAKPVAPTPPMTKSKLHSSPIVPYQAPPLDPADSIEQPHHRPLWSRNDWRLSSPVRPRRPRPSPPSLYARVDTTLQGHNKLIGVGPDASRVGSWSNTMRLQEPWGWKVKVPTNEKGRWPAAEVYRKRLDRLVSLSREAEEKAYLELLERSGTPLQREYQGRTVCRARGQWLTDASRAESIAAMTKEEKAKLSESKPAKAIAVWSEVTGRDLSEEAGMKFAPGTVLRFTPLCAESNGRPELPASAQPKHPQGDLLEVRDGQLVVAFDEADMWVLGDEEYRIDIGNDDTSFKLQQKAIDNLFFDPAYQRSHNEKHVAAAQLAHNDGLTTTLREWTLQGTELRELLVPDLDAVSQLSRNARKEGDDFDLLDDSPAAKLERLPAVTLPLSWPPTETVSNPSSSFADNQLINSWIKRHQRDKPMRITGDPELNLNESQTKAVAMALGERLSLIQGPPGTGKSATIVSMIALLKLHFRVPQPILLSAPTHVSVDHLLSLLIRAGLNPLRTGKADKVRPELQEWTVERRRERHPLWTKVEEAREESEASRVRLQELRDEQRVRGSAKLTKDEVQLELDLEALYRKSWRKFIALEQRLYSSLFATADVFLSTAVGAGASKVMSMVDFPIVFLDEAAMCTEPISFIPLMKGAQHVAFIGDHKQLPAVIKSREAVEEGLHVSLFERLMLQQTVQTTLLDTQYRMRPSISAFPNHAFYGSQLQDSSSVCDRPTALQSRYFSTNCPAAFVTHNGPEQTVRQSTVNRSEADIIVSVVGDLLSRNPSLDPAKIGIISPYFAQTCLLQNTFASSAGQALEPLLGARRASLVQDVEINTVDGFQGREKDVIILSTVRSNSGGYIGFLTDQRRLNVALTRAKEALVVVGNDRTLRTATMSDWRMADKDADGGIWRRYLAWMDQRGLVRRWGDDEESSRVKERKQGDVDEMQIAMVDEWITEQHAADGVTQDELYSS